MNDLARNKPTKFKLFQMIFSKIISKTVIQDGGSDTILNISIISKAFITKT